MNNIAIISGGPNNWAIENNSAKRVVLQYVKNILDPKNLQAHFNSYFKKRGRNYLAVNLNGEIVGFSILSKDKSSGTVRVLLIGTTPGRGIGRLLMNKIYNNAKNRKLSKIRIVDPVNNARGFYKTMGYVNNGKSMVRVINKRKSPSRPSPARPSSSRASSARQSSRRQTPHR